MIQPRVVVGLGNPGETYRGTRHNAGFMAADRVLERIGGPQETIDKYDAELVKTRFGGRSIMVVKPLTFMNLSGHSVGRVQRVFELQPDELLIVYDCMDLPLGRFRLRKAGSSGGHRGMESIIHALGTSQIPRLRIGIGHGSAAGTVDHVLSTWSVEEQDRFAKVLDAVADATLCAVRQGMERAMNAFNNWRL